MTRGNADRNVKSATLARCRPEHLIEGDQKLDQDQQDDGRLQPGAAGRIHDVGERMRGLVDDLELAGEREALFEGSEPGTEPRTSPPAAVVRDQQAS